MREVRKYDLYVSAFELGTGSSLEKEFLTTGLIIKHDGHYEICSKESKGDGEVAYEGDFVKIDKSNNPYPNSRERFLSHHKKVGENKYCQYPDVINSWQYGDERDDVIDYLLDTNQLIINTDSYDKFYEAELWGTTLTAKKIDVILIYSVSRVDDQIENVDFNLIDKEEFDKTYEYV